MNRNSTVYLLHKLVTRIDKEADRLLQEQMALSYKRFHFLLVLERHGVMTQHQIAVALGYSDPAISNMVQILVREGYVTVHAAPTHGRKRLVRLEPEGERLVRKGAALLELRFNDFLADAGVDAVSYGESTTRLLTALGDDE